MFKTTLILPIAIIFLLLSCSSRQDSPVISFYYWKTSYKLSAEEKKVLEYNHVNTLYIRYFDIDLDKNQNPYPLSPVVFEQKIANVKVVPVVYIKNKVMLLKKPDLKDLAKKVSNYIQQINNRNGIKSDEIQIDCDWTLESKNNYLGFVKELKMASKKRLSATIRLHQVKYYLKTKIPNVDYGVLMYYNMGKIDADSLNSIYDKNIADKYLSSLKNYPLDLDVALPIFSWGMQIRNNKVINLISKINIKSLESDSNYSAQANHFFLVKQSNIKFGNYFKENDRIKIEFVSFNHLKEMANDLSHMMRKKPRNIIFYDLDSTNLKNYDDENFKKIINYF